MHTAEHTARVKRLSLILPPAVADEICEQPTAAKAMLIFQVIDEVIEKLDGFPQLLLSVTTTQWLATLTLPQQMQLVENLALMLISELNTDG